MNYKNNLSKIGIWGFGIVGKSAYEFFKKHTNKIQVLDINTQEIPEWIKQDDQNTISFLEENDIILPSPGIKLHKYQQYQHKFITELDIFSDLYKGKTVAITGTLGKTSITSLLQQYSPQAIAAGNIGHAMLHIINETTQPQRVILELSSFQLQYAKSFAPDIAIWTNFYPNHLDHHQSEQEYFEAKCNIFKNQNNQQYAIIPCNLLQKIKQTIDIKSQIFLICTNNTCKNHRYPTFQQNKKNIVLNNKSQTNIFHDTTTLPPYTFLQNWIFIIATLYIQKIPFPEFHEKTIQLHEHAHRLEYLGTYKNTKIYNDSKSTVWQATKEALTTLGTQTCALFLGGLSKGTDRTPLIQYLIDKPITIFAFGKEAQPILQLCQKYKIDCYAFQDLESALQACMQKKLPQNILFSPAGASFDLFKNYIERGNHFKKLIQNLF